MPGKQTFALDIETINTVENPDFNDPSNWTVFAIALGHANESMSSPEVDVLFRADHTVTAEGQLIDDVIDWIADRTQVSNTEILTFNGVSYDIPILKHRATRIADVESEVNAGERLSFLLDSSEHVDLFEVVREREDDWLSLDDALDLHRIETDEPEWMGEPVTGTDMPSMGLELLTGTQNDELREVVRRYAASDVKPLFALHDHLNQPATH